MIRKLFFTYLITVLSIHSYAINLHNIKNEKPYIIMNVRSNDCLNCFATVPSIYDNICEERILLLSDDALMKPYLLQNSNINKEINFLNDKKLSDSLAFNHLSSLIFVEDTAVHIYNLSADLSEKINEIKNVLAPYCNSTVNLNKESSLEVKQYRDSVLSPYSTVYSFRDHDAKFLNSKFQIGVYQHNNSEKLIYNDAFLNEKKEKFLYEFVKNNHPDTYNFLSIDSTHLILKQFVQPKMIVRDFDTESLIFNYAFCHSEENDNQIHLRREVFFAYDGQDSELDIDSYNNLSIIRSITHDNELYDPITLSGYIKEGNIIYLPYRSMINYGEADEKINLAIVALELKNQDIAVFKNNFETNLNLNSGIDFSFHLDNNQIPVIINRTEKEILFVKNNSIIKFADIYDNMRYIYDLEVKYDIINFISVLENNTVIKGVYDLQTNHTQHEIIAEYPYAGATFHQNNQIKAFSIDQDHNKLNIYTLEF